MKDIADQIIANYELDRRTHRIGEKFLPTRSKIVGLLDEMFRLIFPGFFGHKKLTNEMLGDHIGGLLEEILSDLSEEIYHCFCAQRDCGHICDTRKACRKEAEEISYKFLGQIPEIRGKLALDAQAAYDGDPAAKNVSDVIYCYPGFYAIAVYRIAHCLLLDGVPLMPRIMSEHAHQATGTDIHPGADIGKSFFIDHATGVVIGETTKIGDNVKIYQGVTLGALSFPRDEQGRVIKGTKRHPTIEDGVTIYANATILGGETVIGEGVTVAGNTFVTRSVDSGSLVASKAPELKVKEKKGSL